MNFFLNHKIFDSTKKFVFLYFFISFLTPTIFAQNLSKLAISGKPALLESELISRNVKDSNGEVCAGLSIVSDVEGLTFDSYNKIVSKSSKPGQDILFLSATEQVVTIYKSGYQPLKLILNDLGLHLQRGRVWQIQVTTEGNIPINIVTVPAGAQIEIDKVVKQEGTAHNVSVGKHVIIISKSGYKNITDTINVTSSKTLFTYQLELIKLQKITVKSNPDGVAIRLNNIEKGITDLQFFDLPGVYKLKLSKPGYFDLEKEVEISETKENQFSFDLMKNSVRISLEVEPPDAEVKINEQKYSETKNIELPEGVYSLEVVADGYESIYETFTLTHGNPLSKALKLRPIYGALELIVKPLDANVTLKKNEKVFYHWKGSVQKDSLLAGSYLIEVMLPGYERQKKEIVIVKNERTKESITLNAAKPGEIEITSIISYESFIANLRLEKTNGQYLINYDLNGDPEKDYDIKLFMMEKGNDGFERELSYLKGDIGKGKYSGFRKSIFWNYSEEIKGGIQNERIYLKLTAEKLGGGIPWYIWAGGAVVGGVVAILVSGGKTTDTSQTQTSSFPLPPTPR